MYIERIVKFQIPIEPTQSGLLYFEEVVKKHGRKITMKEIKEIIEERFGA